MRDARCGVARGFAVIVLVAATSLAAAAELEWDNCPQSAVGSSAAQMDCGWLVRRTQLAGQPLRLRVVILRARPDQRDATPVVYLPGGPGASAGLDGPSLRAWRRWQQQAGWRHDIVLFDPRGTGQSLPRIGCDVTRKRRADAAAADIDSHREFNEAARAARRCYQRLGHRTAADLGPKAQLEDIMGLLEALAVTHVNLWAVSYGTRIALLFAYAHPDRVRAMALDSLFPFERDDLLAMPAQIGGAIARLDVVCSRAPGHCGTANRRPSAVVHKLLQRYQSNPAQITLHAPDAGVRRFVVTPYRLLLMILFAGYDVSNTPDTVVRLIRALDDGPAALEPLIKRLWRQALIDQRSKAVFWSTRCAFGDTRPDPARWQAALAQYPGIKDYLAPARGASICDFWRVPRVSPPEPEDPIPVPTLVIAGESDALTPVAWARAYIEAHPHVSLLTLAAVGHAGSLASPCAIHAIERFWQAPKTMFLHACGAVPD